MNKEPENLDGVYIHTSSFKKIEIRKQTVIAFIIGMILASSITVYAYSYAAKDIGYTKPGENTPINVETALNELYNKNNKTAQQVATITTQGGSYTFEHDGYILGTVTGNGDTSWCIVYFNNEHRLFTTNDFTIKASLYVTAGTTVSTRDGYGTYNLTCYEWK